VSTEKELEINSKKQQQSRFLGALLRVLYCPTKDAPHMVQSAQHRKNLTNQTAQNIFSFGAMSAVTFAKKVHNLIVVDRIKNHNASSPYPHLFPTGQEHIADA